MKKKTFFVLLFFVLFSVLKPEEVQGDKYVNEQVSGKPLCNEGDTLSLQTGKTLSKAETLKTSPTQMSSFSNFSSDTIVSQTKKNHLMNFCFEQK